MMFTGERIHGSSNLSVLLIVGQKPVVGVCVTFLKKHYIKCYFTEAYSGHVLS